MIKKISYSLILAGAVLALGVIPAFAQTATPSSTPTATPTATSTASATATQTPTVTYTPSVTPTPTHTSTASLTPTLTQTPVPTSTHTPVVTARPTQYLYTVQPGDTMYIIARKTGVSARAIIDANSTLYRNPNLIYPGMVLVIPNGSQPAATATPIPATGTPATATKVPATPVAGTYTVVAGDTLYRISAKTGISARAIINANPALMKSPNVLYPGMVLVLPSATITPTSRGPVPVGTATAVPAGATSYRYTVLRGDTLATISSKTGVNWRNLLAANPWLQSRPDRLYPGEILVIPAPPR